MSHAVAAGGARVYSLALRSVHETKDNLILICVGLLEALDRLQERLRLPSSLVKDLKRKLAKMADRSFARPLAPPAREKLRHAARVGDALAESDMWDVTKPEEVQGLVHWLLDVTKSVNRLVLAGSLGVCRGIFILIMSLPGVSTACALLYRIFQLVDDTLGLTAPDARDASPRRSHARQRKAESYMDDPSLTAVVLEYREKECMVPMNINRRIQRVMHFQIPLRSFEATVRLPPDAALQSHQQREERGAGSAPTGDGGASSTAAFASSSSPRSIPVSPVARKRVQLAFSNFSDDVLYQARDRLRQERVATLTGDRQLRVPRFNVHDCNEEIYLSCGKHCAAKVGPGMHRSVRATVPIATNRYTYFEMAVSQPKSPFRIPGRASRNVLDAARSRGGARGRGVAGGEPSVCVGLSTRTMPLNTLVGAAKYSVGFYSVGHVLVGSERRDFVAVNVGFDYEATVGVLVQKAAATGSTALARVRFSVNGVALRDETSRVMEFVLPFPPHLELFPTLTLHSQDVQVLSHFSAADITSLHVEDFDLPDEADASSSSGNEIWCLDGLRLEAPC